VQHPDLIAALARERAKDLRASAAHQYRAPVRDAWPRWNVRRRLGVRLVRIGQWLGAPAPESIPSGPLIEPC
jgi:hypothetical protein